MSAASPPATRPPDPRRMTKRLAAVVLAFQAPVLALGALTAWALANVQDPAGARVYLVVGLGLAALAVVAAALLRTRVGEPLGWVVQLASIACGVVVGPMFLVGVVFLALWVLALVQGRRMDRLTADYLARHPEEGRVAGQ